MAMHAASHVRTTSFALCIHRPAFQFAKHSPAQCYRRADRRPGEAICELKGDDRFRGSKDVLDHRQEQPALDPFLPFVSAQIPAVLRPREFNILLIRTRNRTVFGRFRLYAIVRALGRGIYEVLR